ncbi:MAG: hypothetical protein JXB48_24910 [Candidatus Latescibacteria bacterium]|nr:hypothetical protein [Candidatus Latescibacterota bacterium]
MIPIDRICIKEDKKIERLANKINDAKKSGGPIIFMIGGAVIKEGCSLLLIDLLKKGFITHLAMNGSVSIHDFEIAMIGQTSEDVQDGLVDGSFGMAEETLVDMNSAIKSGYRRGIGYGRAVAEAIKKNKFKYREYSVLYQAYKANVSLSVHVAIGGDIIHQHGSCDGAALGATSYEDFKLLTGTLTEIDRGVVVNIGSAVIMPEVFLKALTIARNVGFRHNNFTVANMDFLDMYRPRTRVLQWPESLGAEAISIKGRHNTTIPQLYGFLCA